MNEIDAQNYLTENKGLIESIVNKFCLNTTKFSRDDLVQEASLAAVRALDKFDSDRNKSKLSTYVYQAVYRSCRDFVRRNKHDLYKTSHHQTQDWKQESAGIEVTGFQISPMAIRADSETITTASGDMATIAATIPSGEPPLLDSVIRKEQVDILKEEIDKLPERERDIINARFFDDKKLIDIAREQGVTRQRINQISKRAFNRLQENVIERLGTEVLF